MLVVETFAVLVVETFIKAVWVWKPFRQVTRGNVGCHLHSLDWQTRTIVIESSLQFESSAFIGSDISSKKQNVFLTGHALNALRFETCDWRSLVQLSFHAEPQKGL